MTELLKTETYAGVLKRDHDVDQDDIAALGTYVELETREMFDDHGLESTDDAEAFVLRAILHQVVTTLERDHSDATFERMLEEMRERGQNARSNVGFVVGVHHNSVGAPDELGDLIEATLEEKYSNHDG